MSDIGPDHPDRALYERAWASLRMIRALAEGLGLNTTGGFDSAAGLMVEDMKWAAQSAPGADADAFLHTSPGPPSDGGA